MFWSKKASEKVACPHTHTTRHPIDLGESVEKFITALEWQTNGRFPSFDSYAHSPDPLDSIKVKGTEKCSNCGQILTFERSLRDLSFNLCGALAREVTKSRTAMTNYDKPVIDKNDGHQE